jgi:hypothetical protein
VSRIESGAGYGNDPVVATIVVGDISVETHGEANADGAPRQRAHSEIKAYEDRAQSVAEDDQGCEHDRADDRQ